MSFQRLRKSFHLFCAPYSSRPNKRLLVYGITLHRLGHLMTKSIDGLKGLYRTSASYLYSVWFSLTFPEKMTTRIARTFQNLQIKLSLFSILVASFLSSSIFRFPFEIYRKLLLTVFLFLMITSAIRPLEISSPITMYRRKGSFNATAFTGDRIRYFRDSTAVQI